MSGLKIADIACGAGWSTYHINKYFEVSHVSLFVIINCFKSRYQESL